MEQLTGTVKKCEPMKTRDGRSILPSAFTYLLLFAPLSGFAYGAIPGQANPPQQAYQTSSGYISENRFSFAIPFKVAQDGDDSSSDDNSVTNNGDQSNDDQSSDGTDDATDNDSSLPGISSSEMDQAIQQESTATGIPEATIRQCMDPAAAASGANISGCMAILQHLNQNGVPSMPSTGQTHDNGSNGSNLDNSVGQNDQPPTIATSQSTAPASQTTESQTQNQDNSQSGSIPEASNNAPDNSSAPNTDNQDSSLQNDANNGSDEQESRSNYPSSGPEVIAYIPPARTYQSGHFLIKIKPFLRGSASVQFTNISGHIIQGQVAVINCVNIETLDCGLRFSGPLKPNYGGSFYVLGYDIGKFWDFTVRGN